MNQAKRKRRRLTESYDEQRNDFDGHKQIVKGHIVQGNVVTAGGIDLGNSARQKILQWLSPIPYEQHHNTNKRDVLEGTGSWIWRENAMIEWRNSSESSVLWLRGIPGSGKIKLVSIVLEELLTNSQDGHCLAYFYCARNTAEPERSNPEEILRSVVRQMSIPSSRESVLPPALEKYEEREGKEFADGPLRLEESVETIVKLTAYYSATTIIIDALDECDTETRYRLLHALSGTIRDGSGLVKVFVSSRDDKDIILYLKDSPNLFRWVSLQLQNLCSSRINFESDVREELGRLPRDLAGTYSKIYEQISEFPKLSRQIAERSLKWILCSQRKLSVGEFLVAISNGFEGATPTMREEDILGEQTLLWGNLNTWEWAGYTCLQIASLYGHCDIVKLLMENGAEVEAKDGYRSPSLHMAAQEGHEAVVELLVKKGANVEVKDMFEYTSLHRAAQRGHEAVVELLVKKGANVEAKDMFGYTSLHRAAQRGHEAVVKLLVEKGANIEATDRFGDTALRVACREGNKTVTELLVRKGANIEAKDRYGFTALYAAARSGHEAIVKLLVEKGANTEATDCFEDTVLHVACREGNEAITKLWRTMWQGAQLMELLAPSSADFPHQPPFTTR
ncbi:hypothetical protein GP486_004095 [Trichoglossum hirsutum]|uniref:Nephrocystin 3-like N-terminal domain-containing protein n=1 Tax=Trichoglossum hirsutum TaxID=265104 RepID=A0A9P8RPN3_9PEZI|nr:hypothetical protein GP486_004095 [Trichoglossum hirsutum]